MPKKTSINYNRDFSVLGDLRYAKSELVCYRSIGYTFYEVAEKMGCSTNTAREFCVVYGKEAFETYFGNKLNIIRKYLESEKTIEEISKDLKMEVMVGDTQHYVNLNGLRNILHDAGLERKFEKKKVQGMLNKGKTIKYIAEYYDVDTKTLRKYIKDKNIDVPDAKKIKELRDKLESYSYVSRGDIENLNAFQTNRQYSDKAERALTDYEIIKLAESINKSIEEFKSKTFEDWYKLTDTELKERIRKLFDFSYEQYSKVQLGTANKDNFFFNTIVQFRECSHRMNPDIVVGNPSIRTQCSRYWITREGVIRASRRWGVGQANCDWSIKLNDGTELFYNQGYGAETISGHLIYGRASWSDFKFKAFVRERYNTERVVQSFANTIMGDIYQFYGKNEYGKLSSDHGFDIRNYLSM